MLKLSNKKDEDLELLFMVSKESLSKSTLEDFHNKKQILSKYFIGNLILSEPLVNLLRKIIRKISPEIKVEAENIVEVFETRFLKRDLQEGEKAIEAKRK
ncbi:MAG: hypothetical protein IPH36_00230 [Saprospiraceae bacterium]|nr:hypothetical protein [Saprospiraceae bacterium]